MASPEAAGEEFLAGLQRLIDGASDPAERTRLERLEGAAGEVSKAGLSTVIAAAVRGSLGLP